jgi:hypothetical protein
MEEMDCTSQCSRMVERPPATDLSGGKTSEDPFTRLMANLVVEYAVDFQFDSFSWAALDLVVLSSEDFGLGAGKVEGPILRSGLDSAGRGTT